MTQLFVPFRHCSTLDFLDNVVGAALGMLAGVLFERIAGPAPPPLTALAFVNRRPADRSALALVFLWFAFLFFPFFPVTSLYELRGELALFIDAPFDAISLISSTLA